MCLPEARFRIGGHLEGSGEVGGFTYNASQEGSAFVAEYDPSLEASWLYVNTAASWIDGMVTDSSGTTHAFGAEALENDHHQFFMFNGTGQAQGAFPMAEPSSASPRGLALDAHGGFWFAAGFRDDAQLPSGVVTHPRPDELNAYGTAFWYVPSALK